MKETRVSERSNVNLKGKGRYMLAFFAVAGLLYFIGFPLFLLFFFGVLTFFIWKSFSIEPRGSTRRIFDFYLTASEILRSDHRRWFGFEIAAAIAKGEALVSGMVSPPPLVYFVLGSLYQKAGRHQEAATYLAAVSGDSSSDESAIVEPTQELVDYVSMLRKIERDPANAPVMSAAVRFLERSRRNKAEQMLEFSRREVNVDPAGGEVNVLGPAERTPSADAAAPAYDFAEFAKSRRERSDSDVPEDRRTISEVLHDIYDEREG